MAAAPSSGWDAARLGRAAVLALIGWWFVRVGLGDQRWCFLDWANLAFHEAGHVFLTPFGHMMHFLGGTIFQLGVPALLVWYALARRREAFFAAFCLFWLGESMANVASYMADARDLKLDLVGGGEHDWNEIFFRWGVLDEPSVVGISSATRSLAVILMLAGLAWAALFVLPRAFRSSLVLRLAGTWPRAVRLLAD